MKLATPSADLPVLHLRTGLDRREFAARQRDDLAERVRRGTAARLGMSVQEYRAVCAFAFSVWSVRLPWRLLPQRIRALAWDRFGAAFAARFLASWVEDRQGATHG